ncbi:MAG TPA: DUF2796 domain-containing protein [Ramlibacter sp.]|nr:DUF2796 domain-containing protein [Ramlibacter sp.]
MNPAPVLLLLATFLTLPAALAAGAHEHGVVHLDVAVEGRRITLQMESPLDNLLGFERAPRSDAERRRADAVVRQLKAAGKLFVIDGAAQCQLSRVELSSAALQLGAAGRPDPGGHADIDGSFEFDCADASRARFIDVGLFDAFAGMQRIEVQAVTPKAQLKATLKRPQRRVDLVR